MVYGIACLVWRSALCGCESWVCPLCNDETGHRDRQAANKVQTSCLFVLPVEQRSVWCLSRDKTKSSVTEEPMMSRETCRTVYSSGDVESTA